MLLYAVAFLGGIAGLTWELLWMHYTALSLGVSAYGAALTLVAFSLGMAGGALAAGAVLRRDTIDPLQAWGLLEVMLGLFGQLLAIGYAALAGLDADVYAQSPGMSAWVQGLGVLVILAPPAACMGATIPVFARVAQQRQLSIAWLYSSNVAGAALGVLLTTFVFVPAAGVAATVDLASSVDLAIGLGLVLAAMRARRTTTDREPPTERPPRERVDGDPSFPVALVLVTATGFATFSLEVAWFRSLRAAFQATTESFALVLFAVLLALAAGSSIAPWLRRRAAPGLATVATAAAVVVLALTPVIERTDQIVLLFVEHPNYLVVIGGRLLLALAVLGPPMMLIGVILPWCLEAFDSTGQTARLYAANTAGAVGGSLVSAWLLLPAVGFATTAWVSALALFAGAASLIAPKRRGTLALVVGIALALSWTARSDVGRLRAQINGHVEHQVLRSREGPDATVSVIEHDGGDRFLVIDGFHATGTGAGEHYMAWMGHLPMLMHPAPKTALVICFGTGQTANAVRQEGPAHLDIVDVSPSVFAMADLFSANEGVLNDPRVEHHVMDGRAWLRRTNTHYDVITLEPMPPTFAGSNALYSREFYELMAARLQPGGVVAQWLPFHLVDPDESASVTATFLDVFEDAYLWIDRSGTGILLGRVGAVGRPLWPGMQREVQRGMTPEAIAANLFAGPAGLAEYAKLGDPITDDNQRLSYGFGRIRWWRQGNGIEDTIRYQHQLVDAMARPGPTEAKLSAFMEAHPYPGAPP